MSRGARFENAFAMQLSNSRAALGVAHRQPISIVAIVRPGWRSLPDIRGVPPVQFVGVDIPMPGIDGVNDWFLAGLACARWRAEIFIVTRSCHWWRFETRHDVAAVGARNPR